MNEKTVTIKMRTTIAGPGINCAAGKTVAVTESVAKRLIAADYATLVIDEKKKPVAETTEDSGAPETAMKTIKPGKGKGK